MNPQRLQLLRERAKARPSLSPAASELLETLKKDEDLGIGEIASFGEVLPADDVRAEHKARTEDEENDTDAELSPYMREMIREQESEGRKAAREEKKEFSE